MNWFESKTTLSEEFKLSGSRILDFWIVRNWALVHLGCCMFQSLGSFRKNCLTIDVSVGLTF